MKFSLSKSRYLFGIAIVFLALSCSSKPVEPETVTYTYLSSTGGHITGERVQVLEVAESASEVTAVADDGYRFTSWSDGETSTIRSDTAGSEDFTVTASFTKINYVAYTFIPSDGGKISGNTSQTVEEGLPLTEVTAVADNGYRFVKWSDDVLTPNRSGVAGSNDTTLIAIFEEIKILYYSDHNLVRSFTLDEFFEGDFSSLRGYKSNCTFSHWILDESSPYKSVEETYPDVFDFIKHNYSLINASKENVILHAIYVENNTRNYYTIAHALGGVNDEIYLETVEAFNYYYNLGQRYFEIDVGLANNGEAILARFEFDKYESALDYKSHSDATHTYMDINDFIQLMAAHPDITVDIDALSVYYGPYDVVDDNFFHSIHNLNTQLIATLLLRYMTD